MCHLDDDLTTASASLVRPVELAGRGHRLLRVHRPVRLGDDDEFDLRFAWLLRESISVGLQVDWVLTGELRWDVGGIRHLPPPRSGRDDWRRAFTFGYCYYRVGPDFVTIRDTRSDNGFGARYLLDDPESVACWPELEGVLHLPEATAAGLRLLELLAAENLALVAGNRATVLPFRMRRWPVPESSV
ncbi:MAG TPA: DUF5825 family protein [Micromonospora sp.]